jgi:hypothetical protein
LEDEERYAGETARVGIGAIEVHVHNLDQLFHSLDPSPFREKALDRDADEFIVSHARELLPTLPPALVVYLDRAAGLPDEVGTLRDAVRLHYARRADASRRELRQLLRRGRTSLAIGLPLLAASVIGGDLVAGATLVGPLAVVLRESLVIGGWVAMSGPLEIFLYQWWPIRDQGRLLDRLSRVAVRIVYSGGEEYDDGSYGRPRVDSAPIRDRRPVAARAWKAPPPAFRRREV